MRDINSMLFEEVRHFKGGKYLVLGVALHTEDKSDLVIYRSLNEHNKGQLFARPLEMFLEEVPKDKENPTGQKYRLEVITN